MSYDTARFDRCGTRMGRTAAMASVTEEVGIVSLELEGERSEIRKGIKWLERLGVKVEPVEINVIEG